MGNITACNRPSQRWKLPDSSPMVAAGNSEYPRATAPAPAIAAVSTYLSARSEGMMESGQCSSVEDQIERSKSHWSQLVELDSDDEEDAEESNVRVFKALESHPQWGHFFKTFGYDTEMHKSSGELVVDSKFAEGGQAELFHAHVVWWHPDMNEHHLSHGTEWMLKVFKKGTLLQHLQSQWPLGLFRNYVEISEHYRATTKPFLRNTSAVESGLLLKDGRFAFLMKGKKEIYVVSLTTTWR